MSLSKNDLIGENPKRINKSINKAYKHGTEGFTGAFNLLHFADK